MSSYKYLVILATLTVLWTTVAGDLSTMVYPCTSQGECGEGGTCKFGLEIDAKGTKANICECDSGWINHDGKPCSYELKSKLTAFLLSFFLGLLGADWFYLSQGSGAYICAGIFKIITGGALGLWCLIDWIRILANGFNDGNGEPLAGW